MIAPHPRLEVNVAEQLAGPFVLTAHTSPPNPFGASESPSHSRSQRLLQQPARAVARRFDVLVCVFALKPTRFPGGPRRRVRLQSSKSVSARHCHGTRGCYGG